MIAFQHEDSDVQLAVNFLIEMGVISVEGCRKFAELLRSVQAISSAFAGAPQGSIGQSGKGRKSVQGKVVELASRLNGNSSPGSQGETGQELEGKEEEAAIGEMEEQGGNSGSGRRSRGPRVRFGADELRELYRTHTAKEIAEQFGVSAATINLRLREFGIQKEGGRRGRPPGRGVKVSSGVAELAKTERRQLARDEYSQIEE